MLRTFMEVQIAQIVALLQEGFSQRYVVRRMDVSQLVISRTWSRYLEVLLDEEVKVVNVFLAGN